MFDQKKLAFYIEHNYNVLMKGGHGVGKTAMIQEAFETAGVKWKYFSAATMDPWVDFIGIPKEVKGENGDSYIDLIPPKEFHNNDVEAIFLDEFNRAPKKVRNAVMELIQFKSINGVPFPKLRFIWAAINPDDEESDLKYDVEELDPAQKDRFHVILDMPSDPNKTWFIKQFGKEVGGGAVEWWKGLPDDQKAMVSPRRLEYALCMNRDGGDMRDVLIQKSLNIQQLITRITVGSISVKLKELYDGTDEECKKVFSNMNFTTDAVPLILKDKTGKYLTRFGKFLHRDILSKLVIDDECKHTEAVVKYVDNDIITPVLSSIVSANSVKRTVMQTIKTFAKENGLDLTSENTFKEAISEGLKTVTKSSSDRYNGLHGVYSNFNQKAALGTYRDCIHWLANMVYHTPDASLDDNKKPFRQLGAETVNMLEKALDELYNTDLLTEWDTVKTEKFDNLPEDKATRIKKYLKTYLDIAPKRSTS